jgi:ribosomal protein S18 acetylase RimI-like enzyme
MDEGNIRISEQVEDAGQLLELFRLSGFCRLDERRPDNIDSILKNTQKCLSAYDGSRLIGFVRLLTDFHTIGYITDLCVHPDYRTRGIGGRLLDLMIEFCDRSLIPVLNLLDASGTDGFYGRHGFRTEDKIKGMYRINPDSLKTRLTDPSPTRTA